MTCHIGVVSSLLAVTLAGACSLRATGPVTPVPDLGGERPRAIGPGTGADLALDRARGSLHLVYVQDQALLYRRGDLAGVFGPPERLAVGADWWYARITLDRNGDPHVVAGDGYAKAENDIYTNRIGGAWRPPTRIFNAREEEAPWVNFPSLVVDDDLTVFVGVKNKGKAMSKIARFENVSVAPTLARKEAVDLGALNLFLKDGHLLVFGGEKGHWEFRRYDKRTLAMVGQPQVVARDERSEQGRAYLDERGEIHVSFSALNRLRENGDPGFYTTYSRVQQGLPPVRYATTNAHHTGNGRVVRDARADDRVYVFHWSGATGDRHGVYGDRCVPQNRLHYAVIEAGRKVAQLEPVPSPPGGHGSAWRHQPAAVAHPNGGALLVFTRCTNAADGQMFVTHVRP